MRRLILAAALAAIPTFAHADPVTISLITTALITAAISTALSVAVSLLVGVLFPAKLGNQNKSRTREFNPHPRFRFAFGEFPLEGSVVFHHVHGDKYYLVFLLNSIPSEEVNKIIIQEHTDLQIEDLGDSLYDMQSLTNNPTASGVWNDNDFMVWIGLGDHTQAPQRWLNEIGPAGAGIIQDTDTWSGVTVAFVRLEDGKTSGQPARFAFGKPPPLKFFGKWSKIYDPRLDPTSIVTQVGTTVLDTSLTTPPGSLLSPPVAASDGDAYVVAAPATGEWAGQEDNIATWDALASPPAWVFTAPTSGQQLWDLAAGIQFTWDDTLSPPAWVAGQAVHDREDITTWEYSANPALWALTLIRHEKALAFEDELIPIQQYADAADASDVDDAADTPGFGSETLLREHFWGLGFQETIEQQVTGEDPGHGVWTINRGTADVAAGDIGPLFAQGVLDLRSTNTSGPLLESQLGRVGFYLDVTTAGLSPSVPYLISREAPNRPIFVGIGGNSKARYIIYQANPGVGPKISAEQQQETFLPPDATAASVKVVYDSTLFEFGAGTSFINQHIFQGKYLSYVLEGGSLNEGKIEVSSIGTDVGDGWTTIVDVANVARFDGGGIVEIDERELGLLDPVLAAMAGHLDTTDGLFGIRAGVWVEPADALSQPIGDELSVDGARDAGFDSVLAKFISADADFTETDGSGYVIRPGFRVHPLDLPMVSRPKAAARLEKIFAGRAEPNRKITGTWDGREGNRRVGERVNFALPGFARADGTFVIESKAVSLVEEDGDLRFETKLSLIEDLATTYEPPTDFVPPDVFVPIVPPEPGIAPPDAVVMEQSDYRSPSGAAARLKVTVTLDADVALTAAGIEIEVTDGAGYIDFATIEVDSAILVYMTTSPTFNPAIVGITYTVRARTYSTTGGASDWLVGNSVTIITPVLDFDPADFSAEFV